MQPHEVRRAIQVREADHKILVENKIGRHLPNERLARSLFWQIGRECIRNLKSLLFKSLPVPKEAMKMQAQHRRSAGMHLPSKTCQRLLVPALKCPGVEARPNSSMSKHAFTSKRALNAFVEKGSTKARFRLNPQQPNCKESMRIVKVLCSNHRKVVLSYNLKTFNVHWTFDHLVTDGHGHVL